LSVLKVEPSLEPAMVSVSVRVAHEVAGGSLSTTWLTETAEPEVDLQPLRERVVLALPVGVRVAVPGVAGRVDVGVAAGAEGLAGGQVGAGGGGGGGRGEDRGHDTHGRRRG
jgi:hypothetical protein